jgi:DNA-binding transcriptional MocR family regulator
VEALASSSLLYEELAAHLSALIENGALRAGHRLPSVRTLSRQHGVSVATVVAAYLQLENRGLVEARPQSGHYVRGRRELSLPEPRLARPSAAPTKVTASALIAKVYGASRDPRVIPFGAASRSCSPPTS